MKKGEQPEFTAKWWKDSQPKGLKSAGGLESALKDYESAKGKLEASGEEPAAKAANGALDGIDKAVKAVISEASKVKGNADMDATVDCLKKFDRGYAAERKWIEEHIESDDGMFSDPEVYHSYLITACRRLRSAGEMNFGFVLGKKAEQHRMALHKSKSGKALASMLAKETGIHQFTFGIARSSEEKAGEMVLELEGRQLAGMAKKGGRMLKKFKPLPFTKLVLMVDGKEVADVDDPEDTDSDDAPELDAGALTRALAELARRIQGVADPALKGNLARMATQANALLRSNNLPEAEQRIEELRAALDQAGVPANGGNGAAPAVGGSSPAAFTKSRQIWIAARKRVEDEIEKLRAEIVATYQADGISNDLDSRYRTTVAGILTTLDDSLSEKLNEVAGATDISQRSKLIGEARGIMERYQSYLASEPLIADLDNNPFVPLAIRQTVSTTLSALENVVH